MTPLIKVKNLYCSYGRDLPGPAKPILEAISFEQRQGEFVSVLGRNGSGKTTLIKTLAGLQPFDSGEVLIQGKPPNRAETARAIVFQDFALFDWKTVIENVEFGLKALGVDKGERRERAEACIARLGLTGNEDKYPRELSGGMKQRTAIARALAVRPQLLFMDEPFASLDSQVRYSLHELLLEIVEAEAKTVFFVTHDVEEAVLLSDRVIVLAGTPSTVSVDMKVTLPRPRAAEMRFGVELKEHLDQIKRGYVYET